MKKIIFALLGSLVLTGGIMAKTNVEGYEFVKTSGGIEEYKLTSNGLTVLLMEDHSAPVATFMVTYHVGSRNEAIGYTGSTHVLEHLMFKGSTEFNKEKGTPIWTLLQDVGAQINATTWMDRTNYFELLPSEHLERAIRIEADRMRNAFIRDEDRQSEMTVVRNEFERGENDPFSVLDKNVWATAYQAHPYHHSTIGWKEDIENVPIERLKEFYDTFYWPNNSTVTVIGDFEVAEALKMVKEHFGKHSSSPHEIPEMYTKEPKQEGPRRVVIKRSGQNAIVGIAYKTPEGSHEDTYPLQIMSGILGNGKSSRLYKSVVDKGLATSLFMWDFPFHDNGLFIAYAFLTPGTDPDEVEGIILAELDNLKQNGVTKEEVARAQAQIRANEAFSRDGSYSVAGQLNESIAMGDWTYYTTFVENIEKVTPEDVKRVANAYLDEDQSTTGVFIPEVKDQQSNAGSVGENDLGAKAVHQPLNWRPENGLSVGGPLAAVPASGGSGAAMADQIKTKEVVKGLTLMTMATPVKDVVTITGSFLGGDEFSPASNGKIADITAAMLDQGTKKQDKFEISEKLESVGAELSFYSSQYHVGFDIRCLKNDVPLVIELLAEQLKEPVFNEEDLETTKKRYKGQLQRAKESTRGQAYREFMRTIYPEGHPNYSFTVDEEIEMVENVTAADLKAFQKKNYGLGYMTVVAVGDIDEKALAKSLKKHFKGWNKSSLKLEKTDKKANPGKKVVSNVTIQDKTSTDTYFGQAIGIDRDHEDYYPLFVGVYVLGGNFSARLMQTVRDQQGLTYGIGSSVRGVDHGKDGYWYTWGTFGPSLLDQGKAATMEQVSKWAEEGISEEELSAKISTITGSYKVGLATTSGKAGQILTNAERGRPVEYLDKYPSLINALTLEQVNAAIKKYVDPSSLVTVTAGTIDENGKPTEKE